MMTRHLTALEGDARGNEHFTSERRDHMDVSLSLCRGAVRRFRGRRGR